MASCSLQVNCIGLFKERKKNHNGLKMTKKKIINKKNNNNIYIVNKIK